MLSTSILQNVKWNHTYEIHALCLDYGTMGEPKGLLFYMLWSEAHWAGFGFFCVVAEGRDQVRPRPVDGSFYLFMMESSDRLYTLGSYIANQTRRGVRKEKSSDIWLKLERPVLWLLISLH